MKFKYITIFILLAAWQSTAQKTDYIPLLDTTNIWYIGETGEFGDFHDYVQKLGPIYILHDTAYYSVEQYNKNYGFVREDTITRTVYAGDSNGE